MKNAEQLFKDHRGLYEKILNNIEDLVCVVDLTAHYLYASPSHKKILGYTGDELLGKNGLELFHPDDLPFIKKKMAECLVRPHVAVSSARVRHKKGHWVILEGVGTAIRNRLGIPEMFLVTSRDISARRKIEEEQKQSDDRYRIIAEYSQDLICLIELDGTVIYISPSFFRIAGYQESDLVGKSAFTFIHPEDHPSAQIKLREVIQGKAVNSVTFRLRHKKGHWLQMEGSGNAVFDTQGRPQLIITSSHDVTEQQLVQSRLEASNRRISHILESITDAFFAIARDGKITYINKQAEELLSKGREQTLGKILWQQLPRYKGSLLYANLRQSLGSGERLEFEEFYRPLLRWYLVHTYPSHDGMSVYFTDITERKEMENILRQQESTFRTLAEAIPQIVWTARPDGHHDYYNKRWFEFTGFSPKESYVHEGWRPAIHPDDLESCLTKWYQAIKTGEPYENEYRVKRASDQAHRWHLGRALPIRDEEGRIIKWFGTSTDIDDQKRAQEQIQHQALHDSLTGLPNRTLLIDRATQAIATAKRGHHKLAVIFFDLDRFKNINDTLGHSVGDELLKATGQRLRTCIREEDTVGRLGGDEFVILLHTVTSTADVSTVCRKIFKSLKSPFFLQDREISINTSMGVALYPDNGEDVTALFKNADTALYHAKELGRNNYQIYSRKMNSKASARHEIEQALRRAVKQKEFFLEYQPVFNSKSNSVTAIEALLRWHHPLYGLLMPKEFIQVAEDLGLMDNIGEWTLHQVCQDLQILKSRNLSQIGVAVNFSPHQFEQKNLAEKIKKIIRQYELSPSLVTLEITESFAMQDIDTTVDKLSELKKAGLRISIDDFGTGHSSLNYLRRFPMDFIKIDGSFVKDCLTDPQSAGVIKAILSLANTLNLQVIAEGVENRDQFNFLHFCGCQHFQGFLFSQPVSLERLIGTLEAPTPWSLISDLAKNNFLP